MELLVNAINDPRELLYVARKGDPEALGRLLSMYCDYLRLLARVEIRRRLQSKLDASDLVQETLLEAQKSFGEFRGASEAEFVSWLRQVMALVVCGQIRRYFGTRKRDVHLERELRDSLDRSSLALARGLIDPRSSPSQQAARREQAVLLAETLAKLPEGYREVLILRHLEGQSFPEISRRMGRSLDSVEKLWVRGLAKLRKVLGELG
jgi:RNA polymerase sigma-70 factor, ECF subfamily